MKYLIKSIKYFFTFIFLTFLFVCFFVLTSNGTMTIAQALDPETGLWRGNSLYLIIAFFALIAAIYPSLMFVRKEVYVTGSYADNEEKINEAFTGLGYKKVSEDDQTAVYRKASAFVRFMRLYEDEITITKGESPLYVKGLRKDILRVASIINYTCNPKC